MGQEEELGKRGGGLVAWEEIGQLTGSMGLVRREARHHALKGLHPKYGLFHC